MSQIAAQPLLIDIITLFPEMFKALTAQGVVRRAFELDLVDVQLTSPREFTNNPHKTVDDRPYGGGPGMVMMVEPLAHAIRAARARHEAAGVAPWVVYLSPQGERLTQLWIKQQLSAMHVMPTVPQDTALPRGLILLCGRYEAVDERLFDLGLIDAELSVGDVVLSGGELAAMVLLDALLRCLPNVLNDAQSAQQDSFSDALDGLLDCAHYTRPEIFEDLSVPEVLLSGNHAKIAAFRRQVALKNTFLKRPDLINQARGRGLLSAADEQFLMQMKS